MRREERSSAFPADRSNCAFSLPCDRLRDGRSKVDKRYAGWQNCGANADADGLDLLRREPATRIGTPRNNSWQRMSAMAAHLDRPPLGRDTLPDTRLLRGRMRRDEPFCFLSYTRADSRFVERLGHDLAKANVRVWVAPYEIRPGQSVTAEIERALSECDYFLVVLSPQAMCSDWVDRELRAYYHLTPGTARRLLPILCDDCEIPPLAQRLGLRGFPSQLPTGSDAIAACNLRRQSNGPHAS
jgi:hypothetical protein